MIKKNTLIITVTLIILAILFGLVIFKNDLRSYIPPKIKNIIKVNLLSDELLQKLDQLEKHEVNNHFKKHYNELDFPETQFLKLSYKELQLDDKINNNKVLKNYDGKYHSKSNFFLESFGNDIIIASETGSFFFLNSKIIFDDDNYNLKDISSNFDDNKIQILDILNVDENLVISYSEYISDKCFSFNIARAKFNKELLQFEKFFETTDCQPKYFAGRLFEYYHENKKGLLVTIDVWGVTVENEEKRNLSNNLAQDDRSSFGKILFVNYDGEYFIFSKGHRTPQGLLVTEDNYILSTEHGPRGGDEINLIKYKGNYGWPISSYGELYANQEPKSEKFFYKKSHSENNYIEPIFVFFQSIGISQLINVPESFSNYWNDSFLITSLNGSSLYRVKFDNKFSKLLYLEKIFLGKRIRDIIYLDSFKTFVVSLDEKNGFLGFIGLEK